MSHNLNKVEKAAKLYAKGFSTKDVSSQTGVCRQTLLRWRKDERSPAAMIMKSYPVPPLHVKNPPPDYVAYELPTDENFRKHYNKFYPDWKIADEMGQTTEAVGAWRDSNHLPAWIDPRDIGLETLDVETQHERAKIKSKLIHYYLQKAFRMKGGWATFHRMLDWVTDRVTEQRISVNMEQVRRFYRDHYLSRGWACPRRADKNFIPLSEPRNQLRSQPQR